MSNTTKNNYLILSQVFWPDTSSVSQHLTDLAIELQKKYGSVTVITSSKAYEDSREQYKKSENYHGIRIVRVTHLKFKKAWVFGRILNFLSFKLMLLWRILKIDKKEYSKIIVVSVPPLLPALAAFISKLYKKRMVYWVMDIQPELSIVSGLFKKDSLLRTCLQKSSQYMLEHADHLICLDKDMQAHLQSRKIDVNKISVVPVWPINTHKVSVKRDENPFRIENNFQDKIVIMYAGNLAYCHPLDTLLESAQELKDNPYLFVFIGAGTQKEKVRKCQKNCQNIKMLPFQKRENVHISLASADYQVVVMGEATIGFTHPNKIYGAMLSERPIIYIGPRESFIAEHLNHCPGNILVEHGQSQTLTQEIIKLSNDHALYQKVCKQNKAYALKHFDPKKLLKRMCEEIHEKN
ncbi:MAG: glycosyltransferase family 4 protein [bacterium]